MRFTAVRAALAAAVLCAACGPSCDDVVQVPPGPAEPPAGEVWGRVVGARGEPAWESPPLWIGAQQTTGDTYGNFQFRGVQPPYDLVLGGRNVLPTDANTTVLYEGVTCREPVVRLPHSFYERYGGSAFVTGRVPYVPRWRTRIIVVTSDGWAEDAWAGEVSSAYELQVRWAHGETHRATAYVLRYDRDDVLRDRYVRSVSLKDDERRVLDFDHVVFSPAPTVFVNGSFRTEPYTPDRTAEFFVSFGNVAVGLGGMQAETRFPDAFSFDVPYFPGATYQVKVSARWLLPAGFHYAEGYFADVRPGAPVRASLYPGPDLVAPVHRAANAGTDETLHWVPQGGAGVYRLRIRGYAGVGQWNQEVQVYTARTELALSRIPALQLFMRPGATYYWSVEQLPAYATVDDALAERRGEEDRSWGPEHRFSIPAATP